MVRRVFALADLHLSTDGCKPMDVFGPTWRDHASRMAEAWDRVVSPDDIVLLAGDLSWARTLEEAAGDLSWIGARPGEKILLRGNHDSWWSGAAKVRKALPPGCAILQNDALPIGAAWVVVGARGWTDPADPAATPEDAAVFAREVERLRLSILEGDRRFGRSLPRIAVVHFPPWIEGRPPGEVVRLLREGGVCHCVYGHLHGADHALGVRGEREGIHFHLVAADAVGFTPAQILPVPGGATDSPCSAS